MDQFYAYGARHSGIEAVMRLHSVKRWHMIDTTRQQTLAEHSANVSLLAGYISATVEGTYFGDPAPVMAAAILHDIPEVFIGDIPTPTKAFMKVQVDGLESQVTPNYMKQVVGKDVSRLVKLCDLADGIRFIRIHGVDATAIHARTGLEAQFQSRLADAKLHWPREVYDHVIESIEFYAYR